MAKSSTISSSNDMLAQPSKMNRGDVLDLFIRCVNLCEPEHKYDRDVQYPITADDVDYSYVTKYLAKCGPRSNGAFFAIKMKWLNKQETERVLAVMCHEMGHLNYGIRRNEPTHSAEFWEEMANCAVVMKDNWGDVTNWFYQTPSRVTFAKEIINEPNSATVDRRIETVQERKEEMVRLFGGNTEMIQ